MCDTIIPVCVWLTAGKYKMFDLKSCEEKKCAHTKNKDNFFFKINKIMYGCDYTAHSVHSVFIKLACLPDCTGKDDHFNK